MFVTAIADNPTPAAQDRSLLAETFSNCDAQWQAAISAHWPGAQCLHWGPWHRLFRVGDRVLKIQHLDHLPHDPHQHVRWEYELLARVEGRAWRLNPTYQEVDGCWSVLAMDWIDGDLLSATGGTSAIALICRILWAISRVSIAGIAYKQFRPRHIMCGYDGRVFLIDFGGSNRTSVAHAFWHNLFPFRRIDGKWRYNAVIGVLLKAWRHDTAGRRAGQAVPLALAQWRANEPRQASMLPINLANSPGDTVAAEHFGVFEQACDAAITRDPSLALETWRLQWAGYVLFGYQDFGLYTQLAAGRISFEDKRVVEVAAGIAPISVLALLNGATAATAIEVESELTRAGEALAEGLRITGIERSSRDPSAVLASDDIPPGEVAAAVSPRLDRLPPEALASWLANFNEIVLATAHLPDMEAALLRRGFAVETLSQASAPRAFIYARRLGAL